jgi:hypothetical protein
LDPILKALLNSMRCPVCGAQIDGVSKFHCASNLNHYSIKFETDTWPIRILSEKVIVNGDSRQYEIIQTVDSTAIYIWDLDGDNNRIIKKGNPPQPLSFNKKLFDFSKTTYEKLLNRVKTIVVFS